MNYYNTNTETYWETMEGAPIRPLSSYLEGTIIVSKRPSPHAEYVAGAWVEDADTSDQQLKEDRRGERAEEFSQTIDRMNPPWYNSLTATQKTSLETWRQEWLNYPDTGILPTRVEIFN
jgi:hypothetical protein